MSRWQTFDGPRIVKWPVAVAEKEIISEIENLAYGECRRILWIPPNAALVE